MTALEMNPEIRARWAAALRSGKYPQTHGRLRDGGGFCCLGVLCELAVADGTLAPADETAGMYRYDGEPAVLPDAVLEWAGLRDDDPYVTADLGEEEGGRQVVNLAGLNDDYLWGFSRIAGVIEGVTP